MVVETPVADALNNITSPATQDDAKQVTKWGATNKLNRARERERGREQGEETEKERERERKRYENNIML